MIGGIPMDSLSGFNSASLSTAITVIFAVLIIFGALKGLCRGISRQVVRTLTIIASFVISYVTFAGLYESVDAFLAGKTIGEVLTEAGITARGPEDALFFELASGFSTESLSGAIFILFSILLIPIFFTLGFILISAVGEIVHALLSAILGFKKSKNTFFTRILGATLGAMQGALVAGIIIFPFANAATTISGLEASDEVTSTAITVADEIASHPAVSLTMKLGGEAIAKSFASTEIDGEAYDAREGAKLFLEVYSDVRALDGFAYTMPNNTDKAIINGIEDKLFSDALVKNSVSGILRELAIAIDEGRLIVNLDEPYDEMLRSAIVIFEDSSSENIEPDMQTMLNIYFILADSGALNAISSGSDEVRDVLLNDEGEGTVISRVIDELSLNDRTKPITTMLAKLTLSIMSESLDLGADAEVTYDAVVDCLTDISDIDPTLPEEEYTEAVSDLITDTLEREDIGIELDEAIIDDMAKYVYDEYRGKDITEDEINDILLSYFEAYAKNFN